MTKYIDAEKLRAEIEKNTPNHLMLMVYRDHILALIDSLQQEQQEEPDKGLEEAVEKQINEALFKWSYDDEDGIEQYVHDAFIAGAEWQKVQMFKGAVEGVICATITGTNAISFLSPLPKELTAGDKVRIVIVKED